MYMGQHPAKALRHYVAVDTGSRAEGANPHQLVKMLFDELLLSLDAAALALRGGDRAQCLDRQTRALAILHALETSLDFERGGEIAVNLAVVYREARKRTLEATAQHRAEPMEQARAFIADIADAWGRIG
ncbi:MAG TPA: flagellar protein FliS [Sphingobium sp.]|nr:flagellar protein FliS [Sphingobium sp.]